jgi:hypothetical protein
MLKLYRSYRHQGAWVAYSLETGWVIFPETENGWEQRKPARGLDPMHLRQVPVGMAATTGIHLPVDEKRAA